MKRAAWLAVLLAVPAACAPTPSPDPDPGPRFPPHSAPPVPRGALGEPDDDLVQWHAQGQWMAVCRPEGAQRVPYLVLGPAAEEPLDRLEGFDSTGRWVMFTRGDHRWLYDVQERRAQDLGLVVETTQGDVGQGLVAYGRQTAAGPRLVVQPLAGVGVRELASPLPTLHRVEIDRSGQGLWLTTFEPANDDERDYLATVTRDYQTDTLCSDVLCTAFAPWPRRHMGLLWLGTGGEPSFVDLDEWAFEPRALGGAVVLDDEQGVELVHPDRRERVAGPGCSVVRAYYDPEALLLRCSADRGEQYSLWKDGRTRPLDFRGPGHDYDQGTTMIAGAGSRWLELPGLRIIQAVEHQRWGHAFGDHVLMVGDDVEIRDVRTDTRVLQIPRTGTPLAARGPYVAIQEPGDTGGRVIDVRDGHVERTYPGTPLRLGPGGQVALRDEHGRIYWTP